MEKKPEHRPADARTVSQALEDVKHRVETHKSLGAEIATKVARRGSGKDRDIAEQIVAGKRIKKRNERNRAQLRKQLLSASGIIVLLAALAFLLMYALQGPTADALLQKAEKDIEVFSSELKAADPNTWRAYEAYDRAKTSLNQLVARHPDSPEAATAREKLTYLQAGHYYRRGLEAIDKNPEKNWRKALKEGYDKLFDVNATIAKPFIDEARKQIQEYHAPDLLAEGKAKADPNQEKEWDAALRTLAQLQRLYPDSPQAPEGRDISNRLTVHKTALEGLRKRDLINDPEWKRLSSRFEKLAVTALKAELDGDQETAKKKWAELNTEGDATFENNVKYVDMKEYRPWILLAKAKLEALGKSAK